VPIAKAVSSVPAAMSSTAEYQAAINDLLHRAVFMRDRRVSIFLPIALLKYYLSFFLSSAYS
jgi:hypothetical protein